MTQPTVDRCLGCNGELIRNADGKLVHRGGDRTCPADPAPWIDTPPAEPAQPPTESPWPDPLAVAARLEALADESRRLQQIGETLAASTELLECAPAGLTPEQTIRHHALTHATEWLNIAPDEGDLWTTTDHIANYIRDGNHPQSEPQDDQLDLAPGWREELAQSYRHGAADALDYAAREWVCAATEVEVPGTSRERDDLRAWAAEVRAGTRTIIVTSLEA